MYSVYYWQANDKHEHEKGVYATQAEAEAVALDISPDVERAEVRDRWGNPLFEVGEPAVDLRLV